MHLRQMAILSQSVTFDVFIFSNQLVTDFVFQNYNIECLNSIKCETVLRLAFIVFMPGQHVPFCTNTFRPEHGKRFANF